MIVIDGKDLIVGRVASFVAKKALNGETVKIINCEQMYVTGSKAFLVEDSHRKRAQGTWSKGPHFFRRSDRYVRRVIRGMIPHKTSRGMAAFRRTMCYIGLPPEFKDQKAITIEAEHIRKIPNLKYITVGELSRHMGAKSSQ